MTIRLKDLTLGYDRNPAVHHLDCNFAPGSLTAIVGPNGAGKSTLLKAIGGALKPLEGNIDTRARRTAWLPQLAEVDRSFPLDVRGFVAMGLWAEIGAFGSVRPAHRTRIAAQFNCLVGGANATGVVCPVIIARCRSDFAGRTLYSH